MTFLKGRMDGKELYYLNHAVRLCSLNPTSIDVIVLTIKSYLPYIKIVKEVEKAKFDYTTNTLTFPNSSTITFKEPQ